MRKYWPSPSSCPPPFHESCMKQRMHNPLRVISKLGWGRSLCVLYCSLSAYLVERVGGIRVHDHVGCLLVFCKVFLCFHFRTQKIINASRHNQQMHIVPPTTPFFHIQYSKQVRTCTSAYYCINIHFYWECFNNEKALKCKPRRYCTIDSIEYCLWLHLCTRGGAEVQRCGIYKRHKTNAIKMTSFGSRSGLPGTSCSCNWVLAIYKSIKNISQKCTKM